MRRLFVILIILATLAPALMAQSREASILNSLISAIDSARDTIQTPPPTPLTADDPFASLLSVFKHGSVQVSESKPISLSPLAYISRAFQSAGPAARPDFPDIADPAVFAAYLHRCGPITCPYGHRRGPHRIHHGVDVAMAVGDTVRAVLSGTVECIDYQPKGYGHYVVIVHKGGLETRYAHLKSPLVVPGQYVIAGDPIALSGNSGNSTGPHLHFETRRLKIPFNPLVPY